MDKDESGSFTTYPLGDIQNASPFKFPRNSASVRKFKPNKKNRIMMGRKAKSNEVKENFDPNTMSSIMDQILCQHQRHEVPQSPFIRD